MSVLSCSRIGCDSIMCDTYVDGIGYICPGCQEEFKEFLKIKGWSPSSFKAILGDLKEFMETEKGSYADDPTSYTIDEFFRNCTRD